MRREFERLQADYNYALARKYTYPGTVQIIDDVTRVLPDDTWLTQLEMKTTVKGKDTQRELFLRGESANGGKLISLLEDSSWSSRPRCARRRPSCSRARAKCSTWARS